MLGRNAESRERANEVVTVVLGRFEELLRRGLMDLLCEDRRLAVIANNVDSKALKQTLAEHKPRLAILDAPSGGEELARWRTIAPSTPLLVLVDAPSRAIGTLLLAAGASCFARRLPNLLEAVHLVANGERFFAADDGRVRRHPSALLTPREAEVLWHLMIQGRTREQTARSLGRSTQTVKTQAAHGHRKLLRGRPVPGSTLAGGSIVAAPLDS